MPKPIFTLILPCYNESQHLKSSLKEIFSVLETCKYSGEVIFVEDKSTDQTRQLLKSLLPRYRHIPWKVIYHNKNLGRGKSVIDAILEAKADVVGFMDIDCEIKPHYIPQFVNMILDGADMVIAQRIYEFKLFSLHRWLASKCYSMLMRYIFRIKIHDSEAGYKFFRKSAIIPVLEQVKNWHWFFDTEIVVRSSRKGLKIKQIDTIFSRRSDKSSTVRLISDSWQYLINIVKLKKELG